MTISTRGLPERADLGILGGGQLARMTAERAAKLGLVTVVLDPAEHCPAGDVADGHLRAGFDDPEGLRILVERCRVTTFDVELPDATVLAGLARRGHEIFPSPSVLSTIQDKLVQRKFFAALGFPVPRFTGVAEPTADAVREMGYPIVQKARRGGYDGRGVVVLRDENDLPGLMPVPSVLEECVPIAVELSVLVARSRSEEVVCYPPVEMRFDPELNLIDGVVFPAQIDDLVAERATTLATQAIEALDGVGMFAVELFLGAQGQLWLNEIAPRPHNSGHVTLEASVTCQFEQQVRAVLGLPLGDTSLVRPAGMVNLTGPTEGIGPNDGIGPTDLPGLASALAVPGARLHLYGKRQVRPGRKMGHITVLDDDPLQALDRARLARKRLALRAKAVA